jgi:uncharacterized protein
VVNRTSDFRTPLPPPLPAIVDGEVTHHRLHPVRHSLRFRTYLWLVDLDDLPRSTWFAGFRAADHLAAGGHGEIKAKLLALVEEKRGFTLPGDRVVMLTGARSWGHAFNPLTVYWCLAADGAVRWAVLEIHNTYGEQHAHLVVPDDDGHAEVTKELYVSPFFTVSGGYRVRLRLEPDHVGVTVTLRQAGRTVFTAGFHGRPGAADRLNRLRAGLRTPLVMQQTSARIRLHGIRLWLRGLPVVPRPSRSPSGGPS